MLIAQLLRHSTAKNYESRHQEQKDCNAAAGNAAWLLASQRKMLRDSVACRSPFTISNLPWLEGVPNGSRHGYILFANGSCRTWEARPYLLPLAPTLIVYAILGRVYFRPDYPLQQKSQAKSAMQTTRGVFSVDLQPAMRLSCRLAIRGKSTPLAFMSVVPNLPISG